ncbi:MAG TPA: PAS domain-containing sensor histidine kinase, partial [Urbifossiella sp.]|nr:PAS domain-containing sensor histidine kinase [Urbifossiella sp.]
MRPFRPEEVKYFFGREAEVEDLYLRVRNHPLVYLIGPSASGKSSLVTAGLLPALQAREPGRWVVREIQPGREPLAALAGALSCEPGGLTGDPAAAARDAARRFGPDTRLVLIFDQFEALFTQTSPAERAAVVSAIRGLRGVGGCVVLPVMRADFYPDLMASGLWPVPRSGRVEVAPLRGNALRAAIRRPAQAAKVRVEERLLDRLLADAADEPGVLPLVQETMCLLWGVMSNRKLTLTDYGRLGRDGRTGLAVAMAAKADGALDALSDRQRATARRVCLRLVQFCEGRPDTRRQQSLSSLRAADDEPAAFDQTVRLLADHHLITLSGGGDDHGAKVDLSHEALIRGWPTFRAWLAEQRDAEQTRRRLTDRVAEWVRADRAGNLLDRVALAEAERWLEGADAADLGIDHDLRGLVAQSRAAIEEMERERARTVALELSHRQFQEMTENSPVMIWRSDRAGVIEYANPQLTGFLKDVCVGAATGDWNSLVHPDDRAEYDGQWRAARDRQQPCRFAYRIRLHGGGERTIETMAKPYSDETGAYQGHLGIFTDVTEQERVEQAFRQAERRKDEFLAMLAHELRNPLAPIRNAVQVMQLHRGDVETVDSMLQLMERQLRHMIRLIDDLLDLSRVTRGRIAIRREVVSLADVVGQAIEQARPLVESAGLALTVELPTEPVALLADLTRIVQVLGNLLSNAARYTEPGGNVRITGELDATELVLRVTDTGIGIPADQLPLIFQVFYQAEASLDRGRGGLGIGLGLARNLVELHGGSLTAASDGAGRGSTFTVRLPVARTLADGPPPPRPVGAPAGPS